MDWLCVFITGHSLDESDIFVLAYNIVVVYRKCSNDVKVRG
jgi:hypothetical protein